MSQTDVVTERVGPWWVDGTGARDCVVWLPPYRARRPGPAYVAAAVGNGVTVDAAREAVRALYLETFGAEGRVK